MARVTRNFAGSYSVRRPDGTVVATIENGHVAELDNDREWLVALRRYNSTLGWHDADGDIVPNLRTGKKIALDHARVLMTTAAGY